MQEGTTIKGIDTTFLTSSQDGAFKVTLGDLYAEEQKDLIIKLTVSQSVNTVSNPVLAFGTLIRSRRLTADTMLCC